MPKLYAILIAINEYETSPLKGCINDLEALEEYLEQYCASNNLNLRKKLLINSEATRKNIIESFEHYHSANPEDHFLFFFAGHGSHYSVPDSFRHLEPDGELETIVCYDSRSQQGIDLADKELSYLIWEVSHLTENPFITIMDCCHSGAFRTSKYKYNDILIREVRENKQRVQITGFYGFENYFKDKNGRISPPQARRIHLGAARDLETAKEVRVFGKRRGIFSDSLLSVLEKTSGVISYNDLTERVNYIVKKAVSDQAPQLLTTNVDDRELLFLTNTPTPERKQYLVKYKNKIGWTVNAGTIHGISSGDESHKARFCLKEDKHEIEVTEIFPSYSSVSSMEDYNKNCMFVAELLELGQRPFQLAYSENIDLRGYLLLKQILKNRKSNLFKITNQTQDADFLIHAEDGAFFLLKNSEEQLISPLRQYSIDEAESFVIEIEYILKWFHVLLMNNPFSSINDSELSIVFNRVTEVGNYENDAKTESVSWKTPTLFKYNILNRQWKYPAFQINIKNTSSRQLSISLLSLAHDYSITNQLIPIQILEPGHDVWALDVQNGKSYITFPLEIDDEYIDMGVETVEEYLKLIVCTEPFETNRLNQKGIPQKSYSNRKLASRDSINKPDWQCWNIPLVIQRK